MGIMTADTHHRPDVPSFTLPKPRRSAVGLVVSLLLHLGLLVLVIGGLLGGKELLEGVGTGLGAGPAGGGGGGGGTRVTYIDLPSAGAAPAPAVQPEDVTRQQPVVPPPVTETPEPAPVPPPVVPPPTQIASATGVSTPASSGVGDGQGTGTGSGSDGGSGGGSGGGTGTGVGAGVGPGTGGDSASIAPPSLRYWIPPTERTPKELRGRPIEVTFWVKADGSVERFDTNPDIEDRKFRESFEDILRKTKFRPARTRAGVAVPGVVTMQFTLTRN
jgi:hypothetical protein